LRQPSIGLAASSSRRRWMSSTRARRFFGSSSWDWRSHGRYGVSHLHDYYGAGRQGRLDF